MERVGLALLWAVMLLSSFLVGREVGEARAYQVGWRDAVQHVQQPAPQLPGVPPSLFTDNERRQLLLCLTTSHCPDFAQTGSGTSTTR